MKEWRCEEGDGGMERFNEKDGKGTENVAGEIGTEALKDERKPSQTG